MIEPEFMALTADLDLDAFWAENDACLEAESSTAKPRCALAFSPDDHWLFEFLAVESTVRYYYDKPYRDRLHREVNRITKQYVGKAFFDEDTWEHSPRRIENLFGSEFAYTEGATPWLTHVTADPREFSRILDRAEATDVAQWALPDEYLAEWEARKAAGKPLPLLGTGSRGPATIMTSVLQPETVFLWFYDHPDLMRCFRDILARKMVKLNRFLRSFSGVTEPGWWITDDNSALFNRRLYREYCVPVLRQVLDALAPLPCRRYQHSDSAMGHLLDDQRELGINSVNYGPTVDAGLIREKLPDAVINGQMPPFLLRNGPAEAIKERVISDFRKAGADGRLIVTTAGSLAAGTGVGRMRWLMWLVQEYCRYDRT
jgi:uroporphyrinogen decarboxylase